MRKGGAAITAALALASETMLCARSGLAKSQPAQSPPAQSGAAQLAPQASAQTAAQSPEQAAASAEICPGHPDAIGTSRVLAIDPAQFPRVGHMEYPNSLPLTHKELVLTFDDGPILPHTNQILAILSAQSVP